MDRNSNLYTFIFATLLVVFVAAGLAFTAQTLKPLQDKNVKNEKMQSILSTLGIEVARDDAAGIYTKYIKQQLALKLDGSVDESRDAFTIDLKKEVKKDAKEERFPIYVAEKDGKTFYVVPLYGAGLWDAIWGYIALDSDENTIVGAVFDHKGETPGLGAEINESWFEDQFKGEKILDENNNFVSVKAVKGGTTPENLHGVDGISGGTITSDGVTDMVEERLSNYLLYFKNN